MCCFTFRIKGRLKKFICCFPLWMGIVTALCLACIELAICILIKESFLSFILILICSSFVVHLTVKWSGIKIRTLQMYLYALLNFVLTALQVVYLLFKTNSRELFGKESTTSKTRINQLERSFLYLLILAVAVFKIYILLIMNSFSQRQGTRMHPGSSSSSSSSSSLESSLPFTR